MYVVRCTYYKDALRMEELSVNHSGKEEQPFLPVCFLSPRETGKKGIIFI
jgi:hypothetical protein